MVLKNGLIIIKHRSATRSSLKPFSSQSLSLSLSLNYKHDRYTNQHRYCYDGKSIFNTDITSRRFELTIYIYSCQCQYTPRYNVTSDGSTWEGDKIVDNTLITGSPSAIVFKDSIYCFYQGVGALQNKLLVNR